MLTWRARSTTCTWVRSKEVIEEQNMSKNLRRIQNIMERKLWPIDILLGLLLVKFTFFEKPFWCLKHGNKMTVGSIG